MRFKTNLKRYMMDTNTKIKKAIEGSFWGLTIKDNNISLLIKRLKRIARLRNTIK